MRRALPWLLILAMLAGCGAPFPEPVPTGTLQPVHADTESPEPSTLPEVTASPNWTATPRPSPTPTATPLPAWASDLNLLFLGSDRRIERDQDWRTDTLIVVGVRPRTGIVAMLSIPRDLWVTIPGHGEDRINVVDYLGEKEKGRGGGPALLASTLKANLGLSVDAYVRINFEGMARIIDTLGGITITSERALDEWFWDETAPEGVSHMVVISGTQRMDGRLALQYARARHGTSDFDRSRRQQQILLALRDAALRPEVLPRLPQLMAALWDTVETDLRPGQVLSLLGLGLRLKGESYRGRVFDSTMCRDWVTPGGAEVLLPNPRRIEAVWRELTAP